MINQNDIDIATRLVVETRRASFSMLQRRMKIGYLCAEVLIRELYAKGVVGPVDTEGRREVLISSSQPNSATHAARKETNG